MQIILPVVCIVLIILVLLQQKGTALGSAFGQEGGFYGTMRGAEKKIFWLTCIFGTAFIVLALLSHVF
ncbi:MAG: preprotein translocase subunit SecG [Patescibacteria group bacterium]